MSYENPGEIDPPVIPDDFRLEYLGAQVEDIHYSTNLGYGDEGFGFDFVEQVRLLINAGWTPPPEESDET